MEITADDDFPEDQLAQIWKEHGYDLRLIHVAAESALPGDKMWHVVNDCPLRLLTVKFFEKLVDGQMTKVRNMSFTCETHLPARPSTDKELSDLAFSLYVTDHERTHHAGSTKLEREFHVKFKTIIELINNCIRKNHGIVCYKNGDISDQTYENIVCLHFVDVLSLLLHRIALRSEPEVALKTPLLNKIGDDFMDMFSFNLSDDVELKFILKNADIFYMIYGYWSNNSVVPIRLNVPDELANMKQTNSLLKDSFFQQCQCAKLDSLGRKMDEYKEKMFYALM